MIREIFSGETESLSQVRTKLTRTDASRSAVPYRTRIEIHGVNQSEGAVYNTVSIFQHCVTTLYSMPGTSR